MKMAIGKKINLSVTETAYGNSCSSVIATSKEQLIIKMQTLAEAKQRILRRTPEIIAQMETHESPIFCSVTCG
jgi:hypothetical protein